MYIYICIHIHIHKYLHIHRHLSLYIYLCLCLSISIYIARGRGALPTKALCAQRGAQCLLHDDSTLGDGGPAALFQRFEQKGAEEYLWNNTIWHAEVGVHTCHMHTHTHTHIYIYIRIYI